MLCGHVDFSIYTLGLGQDVNSCCLLNTSLTNLWNHPFSTIRIASMLALKSSQGFYSSSQTHFTMQIKKNYPFKLACSHSLIYLVHFVYFLAQLSDATWKEFMQLLKCGDHGEQDLACSIAMLVFEYIPFTLVKTFSSSYCFLNISLTNLCNHPFLTIPITSMLVLKFSQGFLGPPKHVLLSKL
jgi:hypothetical protein